MLHCSRAPPVQLPRDVVEETYVLPAGIGSAILTPVAVSGPWFVTTIVQVMFPGSVSGLGEPLFVTARSITLCSTQVDAVDCSEPSLAEVTVPVLFTTPLPPGQPPPVASVVPDTMCTVKIELAAVVFAGTVTPFAPPQDRTPFEMTQVPAQPEPCDAIDQDRPGL